MEVVPIVEVEMEHEEVEHEEAEGGEAPPPLHDMGAGQRKQREVVQQDAVQWLLACSQPLAGSVFTGIPDMLDVHDSLTSSKARRKEVGAEQLAEEYTQWFRACAKQIFTRLAEGQCAVFSQTDTRVVQEDSGRVMAWIDKSHLLCSAAEEVEGVQLLWHKIALNVDAPPGSHRPGYTHVLCFGKNFTFKVSAFLTPDVLDRGRMTWLKATGEIHYQQFFLLHACCMVTFLAIFSVILMCLLNLL
jgi:hypothetical protein